MSLIQETDYGTPASKSEKTVSLEIDGFKVTVPEGTSIMRAAMEIGIKVPKLCAYDMVESFGSCRLCLVEIEGRNGTPASCTTPVAEGIKVTTQNQRLGRIRRRASTLEWMRRNYGRARVPNLPANDHVLRNRVNFASIDTHFDRKHVAAMFGSVCHAHARHDLLGA